MKIVLYEQDEQSAKIIRSCLRHSCLKDSTIQTVDEEEEFERAVRVSQPPFIVIIGGETHTEISYIDLYGKIPENTFVVFYDFKEMLHVRRTPKQNPKKPFVFQNREECYSDLEKIVQWLKEQNCPI